ncbi:MAG: helix-turn-helix domain-containing protein [Planctomycetaceae bacterium]|nr:MAG: helix-turn-helix domain-containing protein [Planctomycetaceae bacterium]
MILRLEGWKVKGWSGDESQTHGHAPDDACCVFSPDTILRWHRNLVARKYDGSKKKSKPGRKRISEEVEQVIIQIARKNKTWGSRQIKGQLKYLGHNICHTTIDNVLRRNGFTPCRNH